MIPRMSFKIGVAKPPKKSRMQGFITMTHFNSFILFVFWMEMVYKKMTVSFLLSCSVQYIL